MFSHRSLFNTLITSFVLLLYMTVFEMMYILTCYGLQLLYSTGHFVPHCSSQITFNSSIYNIHIILSPSWAIVKVNFVSINFTF